jgi:hypothetical protein
MKMPQILLIFIKRSSLQKSVSKFPLKKFYEIDPWKGLPGTNTNLLRIVRLDWKGYLAYH